MYNRLHIILAAILGPSC